MQDTFKYGIFLPVQVNFIAALQIQVKVDCDRRSFHDEHDLIRQTK